MQRWGRTAGGRQRFRCSSCGRSATRLRPDHRVRAWQGLFIEWLVEGGSQKALARRCGVTPRALRHRFRMFWLLRPQPVPPEASAVAGLILDATSVRKHQRVVLVVQGVNRCCVCWSFAERESFDSWYSLLDPLQAVGWSPRFVVCDGQKGLLKAVRVLWPQTLIQRCLLHVVRQARLWLTQHPKTPAGQALLKLVQRLPAVRTRRQRRRWQRAYRCWLRRYDGFLKQRTRHPTEPRRWWYTHRKLRAVRSLLSNSLPDLFHYVRYPEIPRTTNHVEGGINSRLKDLYRRHRGLSLERKTTLTAWYLASRQTPKKPTRDFL
jgi:hypothetical protein